MSLATDLRARGIYNPHNLVEAAQKAGIHQDVYIDYFASTAGERGGRSARWAVSRPGWNTDPKAHWQDYGKKVFQVASREHKQVALQEAINWIVVKYGEAYENMVTIVGFRDARFSPEVAAFAKEFAKSPLPESKEETSLADDLERVRLERKERVREVAVLPATDSWDEGEFEINVKHAGGAGALVIKLNPKELAVLHEKIAEVLGLPAPVTAPAEPAEPEHEHTSWRLEIDSDGKVFCIDCRRTVRAWILRNDFGRVLHETLSGAYLSLEAAQAGLNRWRIVNPNAVTAHIQEIPA